MTRQQAIKFLKEKPYKFGHMVGFTKLTPLHNKWMRKMLKVNGEEYTLLAHRGSYKTTCVAIVLALIMILLPRLRILFIRKTDTNVKEIIRQVRNILLHPKTQVFVRAIWNVDLKLTKDTDNELSTNLCTDTKGTSQLLGVGIGTSITGKHYDLIFTDDIVTLDDRLSRAERERTKVLYQELINVLNRDEHCRIVNTCTPWHKEDCISEYMHNAERFTVLDTGLISEKEQEEIKSRMLPSLYAANYELVHIASEDVIFTNPQMEGTIADVLNGTGHLDSAFYGEDYTAYTFGNVHDGKIYILGKMKRKHVEDCYPSIVSMYNETLCSKLYNEDNADKGMVARDLRKQGLKVVTYHESMNKHIKIVTHLYSAWRDIRFVEGTDPEYIDQILDYTEDAAHDDAPDSCASLVMRIGRKRTRNEEPIPYLMG